MTCDLCNGTGYRMGDVGTAPTPGYPQARGACKPDPPDAAGTISYPENW